MEAKNFDVKALLAMAHSPVRNYAIPGLSSSLIGSPSPCGTVRLFECSRDHQEPITPHSHRFDFQCWVLQGSVRNRIWRRNPIDGDWFRESTLRYGGGMGKYELEEGQANRWAYVDHVHAAGECYSMLADEVHSIYFERNTKVLFFEGPTKNDSSLILEPWVGGEVIPTFKVESWMFKKEAA